MYIGRNLCLCLFPFIVIFAGIHAVVSGKYNDEWIAALKNKFGFSIKNKYLCGVLGFRRISIRLD